LEAAPGRHIVELVAGARHVTGLAGPVTTAIQLLAIEFIALRGLSAELYCVRSLNLVGYLCIGPESRKKKSDTGDYKRPGSVLAG
jgi:hypothetical protein